MLSPVRITPPANAPRSETSEPGPRPVDDFAVDWCLPSLWEKHGGAGEVVGHGPGPHRDHGEGEPSLAAG
jgi:hypothetical protein